MPSASTIIGETLFSSTVRKTEIVFSETPSPHPIKQAEDFSSAIAKSRMDSVLI